MSLLLSSLAHVALEIGFLSYQKTGETANQRMSYLARIIEIITYLY